MKFKEKILQDHYLTDFDSQHDSLENQLDIVYIRNLKGKTIIGICDDELHVPQEITVNVSMGVSNIKACDTDNIDHTIDYDKVRKTILNVMKNHNFKLLESFADEIANLILENFSACWVRINVAKPNKYNDVDSVGIIIERNKDSNNQQSSFNKTQHILKVIGAGHVPRS